MVLQMNDACSSLLSSAFYSWRSRHKDGWGLAWYLAAELCDRFYASHGIIPMTISNEGPGGYYGISLAETKCPMHGSRAHELGRLTMSGDVENWVTGRPGDHGLELAARAFAGEPVEPMVGEAIRHLGLPVFPHKSHVNCRHKRWGESYQLVFRTAALIALRNDHIAVWNDPGDRNVDAMACAHQSSATEPLGHFLFEAGGRSVVAAGDGCVLKPAGQLSLWASFMQGAGETEIVRKIESWLNASG